MPFLGPLDPFELARNLRRAVAAATRRLRPDHLAIRRRAVQWFPGTSMTYFFLYVVVAPSRSALRAFDDGQVARARAFVHDAFPGVFPDTPAWADERFVLFAVEDADGRRRQQFYVHRSGLIELMWPLRTEAPVDDPAGLLLDAAEMTRVIGQLASAVARAAYAELSRPKRVRRRFARVDWWFQLAVSTSGDTDPQHWTGIKFAGPEPPRASHRWPAAPPDGYAGEELSNVRRATSPAEIARTFLTALVTANGYYDFTEALEQTVAKELSDG